MDLSFIGEFFATIYMWLDQWPYVLGTVQVIVFLYTFFALYVLAMGLYRAHLDGRMTKTGYTLGWPWMVIAALCDVFANLTIFAIIFLEFPREWLVTTRLKRHLTDGSGFRYRFARAICLKVLDYFDPRGKHC